MSGSDVAAAINILMVCCYVRDARTFILACLVFGAGATALPVASVLPAGLGVLLLVLAAVASLVACFALPGIDKWLDNPKDRP